MDKIFHSFFYVCLIGLAALLATSFLWMIPLLLTGLLLLLSAFMILIRKNNEDLYLFIVVGILGAFAEVVAVLFGAWTYTVPSSVGVPYWLPLLWGLAALFLRNLYLLIHDFKN
jgi:hypothetical protein